MKKKRKKRKRRRNNPAELYYYDFKSNIIIKTRIIVSYI